MYPLPVDIKINIKYTVPLHRECILFKLFLGIINPLSIDRLDSKTS